MTTHERRLTAPAERGMQPLQETSSLLLHIFPSFALGGVQARFASIVNHFGRRWTHAIIAMDGDLGCRDRLDSTLDLRFPQIRIVKGDTVGNLLRFRRLLSSMRPARMITSNWGTIEWAMANRIQVVPHVHIEDGFGPEERARQMLRRIWIRRIMLRRRLVVLPSRTLENLALRVWRLDPAWVRYVPNGIDLIRFRAVGPQGAKLEEPLVGTVAALRGEKNIGRLLRAFRQAAQGIPGRLLIVGDGPERPRLEALAAELGIAARVRFAGQVDAPAELIRSLDVFAMSSDTEQMPLSLLEAMAAGMPVAATDVGDIRQMVAAANQRFITPPEDASLAQSLRTLLTDVELRRRVGAANLAKAHADYDQARMFARWADIFDGNI